MIREHERLDAEVGAQAPRDPAHEALDLAKLRAVEPDRLWETIVTVIAKADPTLVGWWKLENEGSGSAVDYSGYDRDGTLMGKPQWVDGYLGGALKFDGKADCVDTGYKEDLAKWTVADTLGFVQCLDALAADYHEALARAATFNAAHGGRLRRGCGWRRRRHGRAGTARRGRGARAPLRRTSRRGSLPSPASP